MPTETIYDKKYLLLQWVRSAAAVVIIVVLSYLLDLSTSMVLLSVAGVAGTIMAGKLLRRGTRFSRAALIHGALFAAAWLLYWGTNTLWLSLRRGAESDFTVYQFGTHASMLGTAYLLTFISSWFFWTSRQALTTEVLALGVAVVWFLSGHRNYHLDAPKSASRLSWFLGLEPQLTLLALGALATLVLGSYLILAGDRPLFGKRAVVRARSSRRNLLGLFAAAVFLLLFAVYAAYVHQRYQSEISRASEGVGQNNEQGASPLGFHSAVGKTKQPAALVRLEGEYANNPWSPMLYLREGALSEYNGRELVNASPEFDTDVPHVGPGQPYVSANSDENPLREKVTYSIYFLAKHKSPIAIDFPLSIRLIKNPDPQRFELAYQTLSLAPAVKLEDIVGEEVGDASWSPETLAHYLRAPGSVSKRDPPAADSALTEPIYDENNEDRRYAVLARRLGEQDETPLMKAVAIAAYLSRESIYTRTPGHQATEQGDPVAPYLFSESKRGYCVHFAHAAVYLMRLLGIPSRIATGYLTDLSYAKDGHVLLQMGDRHAWPEIYVRGYGWVVVDVRPQQAENEPNLVPDEKLLQELMSKLDPAEEFITPPPAPEQPKTGRSFDEVILDTVVRREVLLGALLLLVGGGLAVKLWLRFGYLFWRTPRRRSRLAYASFASLLADIGSARAFGETRCEYAARLQEQGIDAGAITLLNERSIYGAVEKERGAGETVALRETVASFDRAKSRWLRVLAFFSPLSLRRIGRW